MNRTKEKICTLHIIAKTEQEKYTLSNIRAFSVKKFNSNRCLSRCILEALNDYLNYVNQKTTAHTHKEGDCVIGEQKRAKLYKEVISNLTFSSNYSLDNRYFMDLIKQTFKIIDDRSARNYLQKLISEGYIREETKKGETLYYVIPEEAR